MNGLDFTNNTATKDGNTRSHKKTYIEEYVAEIEIVRYECRVKCSVTKQCIYPEKNGDNNTSSSCAFELIGK